MARVVVIGGSIAGLGVAHALARNGHAVTVLERDATALPPTAFEAFEKWDRRGAPQVRHSHAFLARLRNLLRDRAPEILESLLEAGAEELPFAQLLPPGMEDRSPRPGDDELVMLACRRITFEWVLRRFVASEPRVDFRGGAEVTGLLGERGATGVPRIRGVRARRGRGAVEEIPADLVVDAAGRRSRLPRWLQALGAPAPEEQSEPCGIFYCSRFYRLRPGASLPAGDTTIGADLGYVKYAIFHGDSRIFSITFAACPEDAPLRSLLRAGPFEAAAAAFPATRDWSEASRAEPISDVHGMAMLRNTRRFPLRDGEPVAPGVLSLGDAAIHTNPLYGRGCSLALVHAWLLADAIEAHPDDPGALARRFEADTERELVPWYELTRSQDRDALELARIYARGGDPGEGAEAAPGQPVDPRAYLRSLIRHGLIPALRTDPEVARAFFRSFNLLVQPTDLLRDPQILTPVLALYGQRAERVEPRLGPDRSGLLADLAAA